MTSNFIHLRVHTEYSLVDSTLRIDGLVDAAREQKMGAVAVTDLANMFAMVKFYKAAISAGVKPIAGCDLMVRSENENDEPTFVSLLVTNEIGYRNLFELLSEAYLYHQRQGRVEVPRDEIFKRSDGLIALSGGREGDVGRTLLHGHKEQAEELLGDWMEAFPGSFYIELQRTGRSGEDPYLHQAVELAGRTGCPVVATNDVRFLDRSEFEVHEVRVCIQHSRTLDDPRRDKSYSEDQYLKSAQEMCELFSDIPEALENSVEIARRCNLTMDLGNSYLPEYEVPEGTTTDEYFAQVSAEGLEKRLDSLLDRSASDFSEKRIPYDERLETEISMIIQMGFPGYFLIVMEFIQWAKDHGIPVGPGRGSGAGSMVAFALGITGLDPLKYDLLFERFLNPDRLSLPDFDIDFCMAGRDRVIQHVVEKYGRDAVSQIITFGTMAARAVVRDVTRVQSKPYSLGDRIAKLIPFDPGMTLDKALEEEELLRACVDEDEEVQEVMEMALRLEGLARNVGKHAGGVVIAPTRLTDFSPLYCEEGGGGLMTQFDKKDVQQSGLVKFDFLGLKTLTVVDWAVASINETGVIEDGEPLDIEAIPLDDPAVFRLLKQAKTTAVFQLESRGMKDLIKRMIPESFYDIVALVALFRPGPMLMADDFINRKNGKEQVDYLHPDLEPVLKNTYGVMLYQEQVMQIAQVLANFTMAQADVLRAAIGDKDLEEMSHQRAKFLKGSADKGVPEGQANHIFDLMEKFAGYGFNKAHSVSYALVAYQTAWLKVHYPSHFMAAVLSVDMQNTDKIVTNIEESRQMGLEMVPPDINRGSFRFVADGEGRVIYGLGAIKGLGEGPIENLVHARESGGPFQDLYDFCDRVDLRRLNKKVIEALIASGALDYLVEVPDEVESDQEISWRRAWLMAHQEEALKFADQRNREKESGNSDLFGGVEAGSHREVGKIHPWSDRDRLQREKESLGLYLTGHPFDAHEAEMEQLARTPVSNLRVTHDPQTVAGFVVGLRTMKSKRGDTIAFVTLDDRSGRIEVSVTGEVFDSSHEKLQKDSVLVVRGPTSNDDFSGGIRMRASEVWDLLEARERAIKRVLVTLDAAALPGDFSESLARILEPWSESCGCPVVIAYSSMEASAEVRLGDRWRVTPHDDLIQQLRDQFGRKVVRLDY